MTTEAEKFNAVVDGYVELAQDLIAGWTPFLGGLSAKVTSTSFGPEQAAAEFPMFAKLLSDTMVRVFCEAGDALSTLTTSYDQHSVVHVEFDPVPGAGVLTLSLEGDLVSAENDVMPKERFTLVPDKLVPPDTSCDLKFDGAGLQPTSYNGWLVSTDANGAEVARTFVSAMVS
ncbi:MAG: hypothetical protein JWP74_3070 [Marmoricola sp.]|nr:hypothetical protein [Marmoricola sp.]